MPQHTQKPPVTQTNTPVVEIPPLYDGDYTSEQMADILELIAIRTWNEVRTPIRAQSERMDGKATDIMILFMITGVILDHNLNSDYELPPIMNLYERAAPWIQEKLTPLVAKWRAQAYKDPDFIQSKNQTGDDDYLGCWGL